MDEMKIEKINGDVEGYCNECGSTHAFEMNSETHCGDCGAEIEIN